MHVASSLALLLALLPLCSATESKPSPKPCTIHSPSSGSYYDLQPLDLSLQQKSKPKDARTESWYAKGHDYPSNFSLNICGPVIDTLEHVNGVPESSWKNISAFYKTEKDGIYSIGQSNSDLVFRGRRLVLNYTGGSPCPDLDDEGNPKSGNLRARKIIGGGDDDGHPGTRPPSRRTKSTLLSLHCDRDPSVSNSPAVSFVGTLDHCVYFFEARSRYFCGGTSSSPEPGSLGPGGVFGIIILIAVLTYLVGGCAYQRIVMRQRGWRQCPTYGIWVPIWEFAKETIIHVFSWTRFSSHSNNTDPRSQSHPHSRYASYLRLGTDHSSSSSNGGGGGGGGGGGTSRTHNYNNNNNRKNLDQNKGRTDPDEENRLIDQLDEEWED